MELIEPTIIDFVRINTFVSVTLTGIVCFQQVCIYVTALG